MYPDIYVGKVLLHRVQNKKKTHYVMLNKNIFHKEKKNNFKMSLKSTTALNKIPHAKDFAMHSFPLHCDHYECIIEFHFRRPMCHKEKLPSFYLSLTYRMNKQTEAGKSSHKSPTCIRATYRSTFFVLLPYLFRPVFPMSTL